MWEKIIELASQYGPFPVGIIVGLYIKELAEKRIFELARQEREAHSEEKKELSKLLEAQQARIDKLHLDLYSGKQPGGKK